MKYLAGAILLGSFGLWVYAYGFVERSTPDEWDEASLGAQAEDICATAIADVASMPTALEAADSKARAEQIRASTARLSAMVDELASLAPATENDARMHTGWISDWQTFIADRYKYADAISEDPDAQLLLTAIGPERLDRRLTRFADTNKMYSCVAPTDV